MSDIEKRERKEKRPKADPNPENPSKRYLIFFNS